MIEQPTGDCFQILKECPATWGPNCHTRRDRLDAMEVATESTEAVAESGAGPEASTANGAALHAPPIPPAPSDPPADANATVTVQGAEDGGGGKGNKRRKKGGDGEKQYDLVGTIRMFNADKGWGFIDGDAGCKDIFLHAKHFVGKPPNYWIGHKMQTKDKHVAPKVSEGPVRVTFDMSLTSQGKPQALNVRITSGHKEELEGSISFFGILMTMVRIDRGGSRPPVRHVDPRWRHDWAFRSVSFVAHR
eukprot:s579_g16.t1